MMNRETFLQTLQQGLAGVAPEERVAALQYYTEYLDDAGPEREVEVLEELGDPELIIADIRAESEKDGWTPPERTHEAIPVAPRTKAQSAPEADAAPQVAAEGEPRPAQDGIGYPPPRAEDPARGQAGGYTVPPSQEGYGQPQGAAPQGGYAAAAQPAQKPRSAGRIALKVLMIIFVWPFIIAFIAILFALFFTLVVILAVPVIVGVSLVAASLPCLVMGGLLAAILTPAGLIVLGAGFLVLGLGLLCTWGGGVLLGKTVPAIFGGLISFTKKIFSLG